jgi:hypothetical protein
LIASTKYPNIVNSKILCSHRSLNPGKKTSGKKVATKNKKLGTVAIYGRA